LGKFRGRSSGLIRTQIEILEEKDRSDKAKLPGWHGADQWILSKPRARRLDIQDTDHRCRHRALTILRSRMDPNVVALCFPRWSKIRLLLKAVS